MGLTLKEAVVFRLVLALPFIVIGTLNVNGFCWRQKRFLSDQELIDAAIQSHLRYHRADGPYSKIYASPEEVRTLNPGCCTLKRQKNEGDPLPQILSSMLGFYASTVEIVYRVADEGPEPFYESYVIINGCGRVKRSYGTQRASGPKA